MKGNFEADKYQDVFDGAHFKGLLEKTVTWDRSPGSDPPRKYFDQDTDIALHFSTDGIALHKHTGMDAWPLLLTLYSLPPEIRYRREYQICCGIIPGRLRDTNQLLSGILKSRQSLRSGSKEEDGGTVDYDSFLLPLLQDLKLLATEGVDAKEYDPLSGRLKAETFRLRAHLITVCGDMPALAKVRDLSSLSDSQLTS